MSVLVLDDGLKKKKKDINRLRNFNCWVPTDKSSSNFYGPNRSFYNTMPDKLLLCYATTEKKAGHGSYHSSGLL